MLDKLHRWCKQWRVLINTDKSKCIHFRNGKSKQTEYNFSVGRNSLEIVNQYKYLGVTFSYNGSFLLNAEILAKSAGRGLGHIIGLPKTIVSAFCKKHAAPEKMQKLYVVCIVLLVANMFNVSHGVSTTVLEMFPEFNDLLQKNIKSEREIWTLKRYVNRLHQEMKRFKTQTGNAIRNLLSLHGL
ncbi:Hypothetical predicted protein [Mytilus galloprovincialis]|uniref:Reverse transcriptase domain-containing protein n=1 Tax=Mytilus galloprovincialis TaxID=29158 RepID=A0A8B6F7C5_MYTGA|nr:Hypothetical predicted protein [Mytilus galloprovincialis]